MKQIMMSLIIICAFPFHNNAQIQTRTSETTRPTRDFIKSPAAQPHNPQRPAHYNTSDILNNTSYHNNIPQPVVTPNPANFQGNATYHDRTQDNTNPPVNSTQNTGLYTR
jgi:hypothetical protein